MMRGLHLRNRSWLLSLLLLFAPLPVVAQTEDPTTATQDDGEGFDDWGLLGLLGLLGLMGRKRDRTIDTRSRV